MNAPKPAKNGAARIRPRRMLRWRSSDGGTSGSRPARSSRRSTLTNAHQPQAALDARSSHDHHGQCSVRPSVRGTSRLTTAAASSAAPVRSGRATRWRAGLRHVPERHDHADQADRHVDEEDRPPLATGDVRPRPASRRSPDRRRPPCRRSRRTSPSARARDGPSPVAWMVDRVCGTINAAAAPCRMRAATSQPAVGASPHTQRGDGERRDAGEEDPPATARVAEPPADARGGRRRRCA